VDLEKAYDRLKWGFIKNTIQETGCKAKLIELIMYCITSTDLNVNWNGNRTESFKPLRGLRQGDPLSPYIFALCMDKLSHLILDSVESGN